MTHTALGNRTVYHYLLHIEVCGLTLLAPDWTWAPWYPRVLQFLEVVGFYQHHKCCALIIRSWVLTAAKCLRSSKALLGCSSCVELCCWHLHDRCREGCRGHMRELV